jgi:hypothetical protein
MLLQLQGKTNQLRRLRPLRLQMIYRFNAL